MDVPSPTPLSPPQPAPASRSGYRAELAALRARAYGSDADIHRDPVALERLRELEELARRAPAVAEGSDGEASNATSAVSVDALWAQRGSAPQLPDAATSGEGQVSDSPATAAADVPPVDGSPAVARRGDPASTVKGLLRSRRFWWVLAGLVVALVVVVGAVTAFAPHPHTVLHENQEEAEVPEGFEDAGLRDYVGVADGAKFLRYEAFAGMPVWVVSTATGGRCIVLGTIDSGFDFGCGLDELEPMVDTIVDRGFLTSSAAEMPTGSIVRFVLRGDAIEVWVAEAEEPAEAS